MDPNHYYRQHAQKFSVGSADVDMSALYARFLRLLPAGARVLDAGCGSGRDAKAFVDLGYQVDAFDASPELVMLARDHSGVAVQERCFEQVDEQEIYDGIWACASLLHVAATDLPAAIARLVNALRPDGVFYASFKSGEGERTDEHGRRFTDVTINGLAKLVATAPAMRPIELWETPDARPERRDVVWVNGLWAKG
jgi:SAM-dependent methyltransferase